MLNIWSEKKWANITIDVLLFLLGINFMHYAQLVVPIICLLLFVDRKFKFKVNNIKTFIILCLFGISFLVFTLDQGAFAFIGLFLPMAYYVGSNLYEPNEDKVKQIIYIFTLGMTLHIVLNFAADFAIRGVECFSKNSHLDIWTLDKYPTTQTATNYMLIIGILFYIFVYEKNITIKVISILLFLISLVYLLALGRRTPFLLLIAVFFSTTIYYSLLNKSFNLKKIKFVLIILVIFVVVTGIGYYMYSTNIFYEKPWLLNLSILRKVYSHGLSNGRLDLVIQTLKLAPYHLFGGYEISDTLGFGPHELWLDVFDAAGIVPYIFLVIYSISCLVLIIKILKNDKLNISFKVLIFSVMVSITLQFFLEPIMSGSSVILLCVIILLSSLECLQAQ